MLVLLVVHPLIRKLYESVLPVNGKSNVASTTNKSDDELTNVHNIEANTRLNQRLTFDVSFAAFFIAALHGFSALKVLLILYINYTLAKRLPRVYLPAATWIFNIGILVANELYRGYQFGAIANFFLPWSASPESPSTKDHQINWGSTLDSYGGLVPRWEVLFNFTTLRLISFNFDYYWSYNRIGESSLEVCHFRARILPL